MVNGSTSEYLPLERKSLMIKLRFFIVSILLKSSGKLFKRRSHLSLVN